MIEDDNDVDEPIEKPKKERIKKPETRDIHNEKLTKH